MDKHVYIVTNKINGKVYIGQTNNLHRRWQEHKHDKRNNHPLHLAIKKYGAENFEMKSLYYGPNYDMVEEDYITLYNTNNPEFGYNISMGGQSQKGSHNNASNLSENDVWEIMCELMYGRYSQKEIAELFGVKSSTISNINSGYTYHKDGANYPLREDNISKVRKFSKNVIKDLKESSLEIDDICEKYGLMRYQVLNINKGKTYREPDIIYPIREMFLPKETFAEIIRLLKTTNLLQREIAMRVGVTLSTVSRINMGKSYHDDTLDYPIRKSATSNDRGQDSCGK